MENHAIFWQSAMLNYLAQVLKLADEYNKQMGNNGYYIYNTEYFDSTLYSTECFETKEAICQVMELILKFITTEMGEYINYSIGCYNRGKTPQTCIDKLKQFIDTFEKGECKNGTKQ